MTDYILIRSKRKTLSLSVNPEGKLVVRAPLRLPQREIVRFILEKEGWILEKKALARSRMKPPLGEGSPLLFLGREYPIARTDKEPGFDGERILLKLPEGAGEEDFLKAAEDFYLNAAREDLPRRVARLEEATGLRAASVRVGRARKRWGSCSGKNALSFSFLLMAAPETAIDYVVVHELCHTAEHNHSPRFWALVARFLPDYPLRLGQLREIEGRILPPLSAGEGK